MTNTTLTALRRHRAERAAHRRLRRELAAYTTPAEITDLLASVSGDDEAATQVRDILEHNLQAYHLRHRAMAS